MKSSSLVHALSGALCFGRKLPPIFSRFISSLQNFSLSSRMQRSNPNYPQHLLLRIARSSAFSLVEMLMALLVASLLLAALAPVMTRQTKEHLSVTAMGSGTRADYSRVFYNDFEWTVPGGVNVINVTAIGAGGAGGGATYGYKEITSNESNWTVPEGVTKIRVFMTGAGGGGASGGIGNSWVTVDGVDTHELFTTPGQTMFSKLVPEMNSDCAASGVTKWTSTVDSTKTYAPNDSYLTSVKVTACGAGGGSGGGDARIGNAGGGGAGGYLANKVVNFNAKTLYIRIPGGGSGGCDCGTIGMQGTAGGEYSGSGGGGSGATNTFGAGGATYAGSGGRGYYSGGSLTDVVNAGNGGNGNEFVYANGVTILSTGGNSGYSYFTLDNGTKSYQRGGAGGYGGLWGGAGGGGGRSSHRRCGGGGGGGGGPTTILTSSTNDKNSIIFQVGGGGGGGGGGGPSVLPGTTAAQREGSCGSGGSGGGGGGYGGGAGGAGATCGTEVNNSGSGASYINANLGGGKGYSSSPADRQNGQYGGGGYGATTSTIFGDSYCKGGTAINGSYGNMMGFDGKPGAMRIDYSYPAIKCQRNVPDNSGGGGGAGQIWMGEISVTPGQRLSFNIGNGGDVQSNPSSNGKDGTATSISINGTTVASVSGGKGGKYESDNTYISNSGGNGGGINTADFSNIAKYSNWMGVEGILGGQRGSQGNTVSNGSGGGAGGKTYKKDGTILNGGSSVGSGANGSDAPSSSYGAGGGGGGGVMSNNGAFGKGGKGANGYIYIEWGNSNGGGGASGQVVTKKNIWVSAGSKVQITVGKGGEAKPVLASANGLGYYGQKGNDGGDSFIKTTEGEPVRAKGGEGGYPAGTAHGLGGNYEENVINSSKGESGMDGYGGAGGSITEQMFPLTNTLEGLGGCGGNMTAGNCNAASSTGVGKNAGKTGGGGGGGAVKDGNAYTGGKGANGMVVIEWNN